MNSSHLSQGRGRGSLGTRNHLSLSSVTLQVPMYPALRGGLFSRKETKEMVSAHKKPPKVKPHPLTISPSFYFQPAQLLISHWRSMVASSMAPSLLSCPPPLHCPRASAGKNPTRSFLLQILPWLPIALGETQACFTYEPPCLTSRLSPSASMFTSLPWMLGVSWILPTAHCPSLVPFSLLMPSVFLFSSMGRTHISSSRPNGDPP